MRYILDAFYGMALIVTSPYWIYQSIRTGKYRRGLMDRVTGLAPRRLLGRDKLGPRLWIHAVSVGEVAAAGTLIGRLQRNRPEVQIVLSSTTDSGFDLAKRRHPDLAVFRAPLDFSWTVERFLDGLAPDILILVELELWPNLLLQASRRGLPVAVVNARMSARSHRGYRLLQKVLQPAFAAVRWWGVQSQEYADRIADLVSTPPARISVTGSVKMDGALTDRGNERTMSLRRLLGIQNDDVVFVAGSTQPPEEEILLDWWERIAAENRRLRFLLAPRSPERFDAVADQLQRRGLPFLRRSKIEKNQDQEGRCPIILLDTIGELAAAWGLASLGYVGGSWTPGRGGQSMIEPAGFGVPVCFGPHTANFQSTVESLLCRNAARQVNGVVELRETLTQWIQDLSAARAIGQRAKEFVLTQQGAADRTIDGLDQWLPAA